MSKKKPVVCIPCNVIDFDGTKAHAVRETYINALIKIVDCMPLLIPCVENGCSLDISTLLRTADGFLFPGSFTHISPDEYGAPRTFADNHLDVARDSTAIPMLKQILAADKPLLVICRGFQELNVALGGTLNQKVYETEGYIDHRGNKDIGSPGIFTHQAHTVTCKKGGVFERIGLDESFTVNSIHEQGIDVLAPGLFIEATAEDGLIEAVSVPGKKFALGTQWHPEGDWHVSPNSKKIITAFGDALRQ